MESEENGEGLDNTCREREMNRPRECGAYRWMMDYRSLGLSRVGFCQIGARKIVREFNGIARSVIGHEINLS